MDQVPGHCKTKLTAMGRLSIRSSKLASEFSATSVYELGPDFLSSSFLCELEVLILFALDLDKFSIFVLSH